MIAHLIHDTDRDGWGSAAMLLAEFGPERCELHPHPGKDVRSALNRLGLSVDDRVFVLDLPAPPTWTGLRKPPCRVTWVDHHLSAWREPAPSWIEVVLPETSKPTVTMALLVKNRLVPDPAVIDRYVSGLCGGDPDSDWGAALDALKDPSASPMAVAELARLLALGPAGAPLPSELRPLADETRRTREIVDVVLSGAPTVLLGEHLVRVDIANAHGVPLARYSLAARGVHGDRVVAIVHRGSRLYVGRPSGREGLDLVKHFTTRELRPKGHPYVCTVQLSRDRVDHEVSALREAIEGHEEVRA